MSTFSFAWWATVRVSNCPYSLKSVPSRQVYLLIEFRTRLPVLLTCWLLLQMDTPSIMYVLYQWCHPLRVFITCIHCTYYIQVFIVSFDDLNNNFVRLWPSHTELSQISCDWIILPCWPTEQTYWQCSGGEFSLYIHRKLNLKPIRTSGKSQSTHSKSFVEVRHRYVRDRNFTNSFSSTETLRGRTPP